MFFSADATALTGSRTLTRKSPISYIDAQWALGWALRLGLHAQHKAFFPAVPHPSSFRRFEGGIQQNTCAQAAIDWA